MKKNNTTSSSQEVQDLLGDGLARSWWQSPTVWIGAVAVAVAVGGFVWWQADQKAKAKPVYVTEALKRGTLSLTALAMRALGRRTPLVFVLGMVGAAMFLGDSFITPAISGSSFMRLFSTHPTLEARIEALQKIEMELEA